MARHVIVLSKAEMEDDAESSVKRAVVVAIEQIHEHQKRPFPVEAVLTFYDHWESDITVDKRGGSAVLRPKKRSRLPSTWMFQYFGETAMLTRTARMHSGTVQFGPRPFFFPVFCRLFLLCGG